MTNKELQESYGELLCHCDKSFDSDFKRMIESGHLLWKPWIGADWRAAERRILVVGESHYAAKPDANDVQAKLEEWQNDPDGTREIVCEVGVDEWYASRFFGNLHRAFFGVDVHGEGRTALWRHLAFCNFIQRPMRDSSERPGPGEFYGGWRHFMELLKLLRPDTVLFVGVSAAKYFDGAMSALGMEHKITFDEYRNGAFPCQFSVTYDGMSTDMVAIRHTSQYFSWETWRDYLVERIPKHLAYLQKVASVAVSAATEPVMPDAEERLSEEIETIAEGKLEGLPTWLRHKPVVACNYQDINDGLGQFDYDDSRFISVGHAQWNPDDVSVKMFRMGDSGRWSRQSEEVPVQRLPYMMAMLLAAIFRIQHPAESTPGNLGDVVVAPQDMELLREQLHVWAEPLRDGLVQVKNLLNRISLEDI